MPSRFFSSSVRPEDLPEDGGYGGYGPAAEGHDTMIHAGEMREARCAMGHTAGGGRQEVFMCHSQQA